MKQLFIEMQGFTEWVGKYLDDEVFGDFQRQLTENPELGSVMPGCGGLRKVRVRDPRRHKGKRGGVRIIYLNIPEAGWIFLVDIYGKDEKDDLTAVEKRTLRRLAESLRHEAAESVRRMSSDE